jgi:hypothetical protein
MRPRRPVVRTSPFHGGNTGSNPVGDAKSSQQLSANPQNLPPSDKKKLFFGWAFCRLKNQPGYFALSRTFGSPHGLGIQIEGDTAIGVSHQFLNSLHVLAMRLQDRRVGVTERVPSRPVLSTRNAGLSPVGRSCRGVLFSEEETLNVQGGAPQCST